MTTMTKADVKSAPTKQLVEFYNAHSGRGPIIKFVDRATAEKRVKHLIDMLAGTDSPGTSEEPAKPTAEPKPAKKKAARKAEPKDPVATHEKRAASISKSWKDPDTAAARSARNGCKVGGVVYTSVPKAFAELGLDMKKHQRVRRQMVVNGHVTFEGHRFTLVREA